MIKSEFTFRRFLDTFVPGFIVVIAIWYLYKPYINKFFPTIVLDPTPNTNNIMAFSSEMKLVVLLIISIFVGILVNHFADIPVAFMYKHPSNKRHNIIKHALISFMGRFLIYRFFAMTDPRVVAIDRYMQSKRSGLFNKMLKKWIGSNCSKLKDNDEEKIIIHQHLCTRLRIINPFTEKIYNGCYSEVIFASSTLMSLIIIFISTLILLALNIYHDLYDIASDFSLKFIETRHIILILILEYALLLIMTYSVIRTFRHFSSQIITLTFHVFLKGNNIEESND